ncbi:hypothetical protein [Mycobacterium riyadhense]|uniref:hypothetical protein n=1 Tax=Mycobacterium riyadhense TaxID=486698 RepID=UPI001951A2A7|nr:hypothetical protein [Mycobacterium riyadhense]
MGSTYPGDSTCSTAIRKEGIVGIRSNAHFGVKEQLLDAVVRGVREALEGNFDATHYGVSEVLVERQDDDSFVIRLKMVSGDAEQADADADRAVEAIKELLGQHFERGAVRERQRELTLA